MTPRPPACRITVLAALLAGGCSAVGPEFQRPEVPWLEDWPGPSPPFETTAAQAVPPAPVDEWWQVFAGTLN